MAAIFSDHAVLQRDRPIEVWGQSGADEQVLVTMSGASRKTQADASGRWSVSLPSFRAGGPYQLMARTATRQQQVNDVLVGDVWLCSGQSNMEFAVRNSINADSEVQHSANDGIRHLTISRDVAAAANADLRHPTRMESGGSVDHAGFFGGLLLLRARIAEVDTGAPGPHPFFLGRHAHRDLAVRAGTAPAGWQ